MGMCSTLRKPRNISSLGDYLWNDCRRGQVEWVCMCVNCREHHSSQSPTQPIRIQVFVPVLLLIYSRILYYIPSMLHPFNTHNVAVHSIDMIHECVVCGILSLEYELASMAERGERNMTMH